MTSENRISTSTNLLCFKRDGGKRKMIESIPLLAKAGYASIDLNFCELMNPHSDIDEDYILTLERMKKEYGLNYNQCHVPYSPDYLGLSEMQQKEMDKLIIRAFGYAHQLGVDTVVIHPIRGSIEANIAYFKRMLESFPPNMRLAVENMESAEEISLPEELLKVVKAFEGRLWICLDTGHAHMRGLDIPAAIHKFGKYLAATHIADNHGNADEHLMPFFGTIKWEEVMKAFSAIGYKDYFTFEIMFFFKYLPEELQTALLPYSLQTAEKLISLL